MKIILSRKGFDSSFGGVPSPIFPDGRTLSLPIPDKSSPVKYEDIFYQGSSIGNLVSNLTGGRIPPYYRAHIDPDLRRDSLKHLPKWRPIFGQTGQAQSHLRNNNVGIGDLFLFFGLFRRVEMINGFYEWVRNAKPYHVIWGWLQVAEVLHLSELQLQGYEWAQYHPHFNRNAGPNNVVYVACQRLKISGKERDLPGAGVFSKYHRDLQLTASQGDKLSLWELPGWFFPENRRPLTYHTDKHRWRKRGDRVELESVVRGQEFVLDCEEYPEATHWALKLIEKHNGC